MVPNRGAGQKRDVPIAVSGSRRPSVVVLENAVRENVEHYHAERNHQGLGNQLIEPGNEVGPVAGKIECYERLGGILKYYHRRAA